MMAATHRHAFVTMNFELSTKWETNEAKHYEEWATQGYRPFLVFVSRNIFD
jgi:hypothetical protein